MGQVAEVSVSKRGEVRVEHVVCAIDCGHVVNPLTIEEQLESATVYGLTALLYGQITIEKGRVADGTFDTYQILRINGMPEVETYLALRRGHTRGAVGAPRVPTTAPAVCNALFQLTGNPIRP